MERPGRESHRNRPVGPLPHTLAGLSMARHKTGAAGMRRQGLQKRQRGRVPFSEAGQNPDRDFVIPAEARIQKPRVAEDSATWILACARMTNQGRAHLGKLSEVTDTAPHIGRRHAWSVPSPSCTPIMSR